VLGTQLYIQSCVAGRHAPALDNWQLCLDLEALWQLHTHANVNSCLLCWDMCANDNSVEGQIESLEYPPVIDVSHVDTFGNIH
jgi:hypothetical protein